MNRHPVRLGLVGAGPWGRNYIKTISGINDITLAWLYSTNAESRKLVGSKCQVTSDWRELIRAKDLDGIIVATPPQLHTEITQLAISSGLGVLVEKPLAMSVKDAETTLQLAERKNALVYVDHINLYNPAFRKLKNLAHASGPVKFIHSMGGKWGPFRKDTSVLWDWGPHDISMCLDILGQVPVKVDAKQIRHRTVHDTLGELLCLKLYFENNITARIFIGNIFKNKRRLFNVHSSDRVISFDDLKETKLRIIPQTQTSSNRYEAVDIDATPPLTIAIREFADDLQKGALNFQSLRLAVEVTRVLSQLDSSLGRN